MKRLKTAEQIAKEQKRNRIIVGGVMIFLMAFGSIGFAISGFGGGTSGNENEIENQDSFFNGQYWVHTVGGQQYLLKSSIDSVKDVSVDINKGTGNFGGNVYVSSNVDEVYNELGVNLARYASRFQEACYGECEKDLPEKDCSEKLIVFRESEVKKVYEEGSCVIIEGDMVAVDAFLYRVLGIS